MVSRSVFSPSLCVDLRVQIQVENIRQAHQIVENTDDVSGQVDIVIGETRLPQFLQILIDDLRGSQRDLLREFQEDQCFRIQRGTAKVGGELLDQLGRSAFETEKLSVQLGSILAAIGLGGYHCNHFSLKACQSGRIRHEPGEQLSEGHSDIEPDRG